jgi:hypothetical protein
MNVQLRADCQDSASASAYVHDLGYSQTNPKPWTMHSSQYGSMESDWPFPRSFQLYLKESVSVLATNVFKVHLPGWPNLWLHNIKGQLPYSPRLAGSGDMGCDLRQTGQKTFEDPRDTSGATGLSNNCCPRCRSPVRASQVVRGMPECSRIYAFDSQQRSCFTCADSKAKMGLIQKAT